MLDTRLSELASRQYGSFSRSQVLDLGGTDDHICRRLHGGRWEALAPGVYGLAGWPPSWRRSLWLAHLDVGLASVVSHESAAALHRLATFAPGPVVVTVRHGDHERIGPFRVHQSTDLRPTDVIEVGGLPVTSPARTLFDLAAVTSRSRLERALDDAHVGRACRVDEVRALYDALRRRGKPGMGLLGEVLAARGPGYVPTESVLERRLLKVLLDGGLPEPRRQYPLPWRADAEGRLDFAYPPARVLIEGDSRRWHARMDTMAEDRRRDRDALNHGWQPYRFVWEEITRRPALIVDTIGTALTRAAA